VWSPERSGGLGVRGGKEICFLFKLFEFHLITCNTFQHIKFKIKIKKLQVGRMAQAVGCLSSKQEALSSTSNIVGGREGGREKRQESRKKGRCSNINMIYINGFEKQKSKNSP
jgi:hypothetical protein